MRAEVNWDALAQISSHVVNPLPGQRILIIDPDGSLASKFRQFMDDESVLIHEVAMPQDKTGQFDVVLAVNVVSRAIYRDRLQHLIELLRPGGKCLLLQVRIPRSAAAVYSVRGASSQPFRNLRELYETMSAVGFESVFASRNCLPVAGARMLRTDLVILKESAPILSRWANCQLIFGRKPGQLPNAGRSLCDQRDLIGRVSFLVPCHNEDSNVESLVNGIRSYFDAYVHEIVLVDDNSTDSTREVIERLAGEDSRILPLLREAPAGVGRALIDGLRMTSGDFVLSIDCDFQHLLPALRGVFRAADRHGVVVGSRFNGSSFVRRYPFRKLIANRAFHVLARLGLGQPLQDITNNVKLMSRDVVNDLRLTQPNFAVNAETSLLPLLMGYSLREVPMSWVGRDSDMGVSSFDIGRVGGGYVSVLFHAILASAFGRGRYGHLVAESTRRRTQTATSDRQANVTSRATNVGVSN